MNLRKLGVDYAIAPQIEPGDLAAIAAQGFRSVLCARPDNEDPGQPSFAVIARAAEAAGLKAVQVPISGMLTDAIVAKGKAALADLPRPVFGYCRSGRRAGNLIMAGTQGA
jgi:uncharacterized protein (TIGR01244 family)